MVNFLLEVSAQGSSDILNFFRNIVKFVGQSGFDIIFYVFAGLLVLNILIALISVSVSYEIKLLRSVKKLNKFFLDNPKVSEDNLISLNNRMKKVPKTLRYCWQEYMLYRDKLPSEYMSTTACIDQPLKTSHYANTVKVTSIFGSIIAGLAFLCFLAIFVNLDASLEISSTPTINMIWQMFTIPVLLWVINYLIVIILRTRRTSVIGNLYFDFHDFSRSMNKACASMPSFIDYEVLFTQKEIRDGIPVLQEYLEKRAFEEQQAAERAKEDSAEFEQFDFNELGIENAILLDRAMKESEKYFNVKRDLTEKLNSKETEINNFSKSFDEVTKDYERKAQAIKENLSQLNEQLNNTAVKIEANYIKKRHSEEQVKLQQLEKDYDIASVRFNKQQSDLEEECEVLRNEIKERKGDVEEAIKVEGKAYANKVYGIIGKTIKAQNEPYFSKLEGEKQQLSNQVNQLNQALLAQQAELEARKSQISQFEQDLNLKKAQIAAIASVKEYFSSLEFKQMVKNGKKIDKIDVESNKEYAQMIEQLENQLNDKQSEVGRLTQNLNQLQAELATKQNELQLKEQEIQAKNNEIDAKNGEIKSKIDEIETQKVQLMEQSKKLENFEQNLKETDANYQNEKNLSEENQNNLLGKLKNLEDNEKKIIEQKTKIKSQNLDKLHALQKGINSKNTK